MHGFPVMNLGSPASMAAARVVGISISRSFVGCGVATLCLHLYSVKHPTKGEEATMVIEIPLTQGKVAIIDEADWPLVSGFGWYALTSSPP